MQSFQGPMDSQLEYSRQKESYIKEAQTALSAIWTTLCSFELHLLKKNNQDNKKYPQTQPEKTLFVSLEIICSCLQMCEAYLLQSCLIQG